MVDGGGPVTAGGSAQRMADEMTRKAAVARAQVRLLEKNAAAWTAGADGERLVATALAGYGLEGRVLHDRLLRPGRSFINLDHVVVSSAGVFVLDTKNWTGELVVHHDRLRVRRVGSDGKTRFAPDKGGLVKVGGYATEMGLLLGVRVRPLVVLANDSHAGFPPQTVGGVDVVPVGRLREWFLRQPVVLDDLQRDLLGLQCDTSFPETSPLPPLEGSDAVRAPRARAPRATPSSGATTRVAPRASRRLSPARPAPTRRRRGRRLAQAVVVGLLMFVGVTQIGPLTSMLSTVVVGALTPHGITATTTPDPSSSPAKTTQPKKRAPVKAPSATQRAQAVAR
ncbi:MAG: hypothetical protein JWP31_1650 [Aeromicrobium sp.]|nr:hypothetical protein [Aeromicrobium sp.]